MYCGKILSVSSPIVRCECHVSPSNRVNLSVPAKEHDCIGDVRGSGLFLALELVSDRGARMPATELAAIDVESLRERGVLTGCIGPDSNILKLRSPMTLSRNNAEYFLSALKDSL